MTFDSILRTITMIGADLPAYKELFDQIVATMHSDDQVTLKAAYADALDAAARAHESAQAK